MSAFEEAQERDMVLHVGSYLDAQKNALKKLADKLGKEIFALVLIDATDPHAKSSVVKDSKATVIECDFSSVTSLQTLIKPYTNRLVAVTCRAERNIPLLKKLVPHVPYLNTPSESSLEWTTNKIKMRQLLRGYDKDLSPKFLVVHDASDETIDRIIKKIGFPMIIKPAGLAASLLVTLCYHREELESTLKNTVKKIDQIYRKNRVVANHKFL